MIDQIAEFASADRRRRRRWLVPAALCGILAALLLAASPSGAHATANSPTPGPVGAVYVASNAIAGNAISIFNRFADGHLEPAGSVATGGLGSGPDTTEAALTFDPLGSQNSLITDPASRLLFAVNAGSDSVSVFRIGAGGRLSLAGRPVSSSGAFPVSLAYNNSTLYVLNGKGNSLTGFAVSGNGTLTRLDTCPLPPLPASEDGLITQTPGQVGFSPDGAHLVVVSKEGLTRTGFPDPNNTLGNGHIYVYRVGSGGWLANCGSPATTELSPNRDGGGKFPFDFAWSDEGHLLLNEVFGDSASLTGSEVSSFALAEDGSLSQISEVATDQGVACWIVRTDDKAFVANYVGDAQTFNGSISSLSVTKDGRLSLNNPPAVSLGAGAFPVDLAVTNDGKFLYQLTPGLGAIRPFAVNTDSGALTPLTALAGVLSAGWIGIATADFGG
jgi:6-phosphogluconolactonase (cycloisomerase 2 family)